MLKITLLLSTALLASCVTQSKYDEALATAQMYQRDAHDRAEYITQLEASQAQQNAQEATFDPGTIDASYTADIDARLDSLRGLLSGRGHDMAGVSLFEVEGGYGYSMENSVVFSSGSAVLTASGRELIGDMAKQIAGQPFQRIWIRGHSDSDKVSKASTLKLFPHGNIQLSGARALEVAMALKAGGMSEDVLAIAGLGSSLPVASNDTPEGKAQNRRVEIFVIDQQDKQ